jgi:hypothetical protein
MDRSKAGAVVAMLVDRGVLPAEGWELTGSYRRGAQEIECLKILVPADKHGMDRRFVLGESAVIYFCPKEAWAPMLLHTTGSGPFIVGVQREAKSYGYYLQSNGLFQLGTDERVDMNTEEDILMHVGVGWYDPEERVESPCSF